MTLIQTKPTRSKEVKSNMGKANWKVITRGFQNTTYVTLVTNSKISGTLLRKQTTIKLNLYCISGLRHFQMYDLALLLLKLERFRRYSATCTSSICCFFYPRYTVGRNTNPLDIKMTTVLQWRKQCELFDKLEQL